MDPITQTSPSDLWTKGFESAGDLLFTWLVIFVTLAAIVTIMGGIAEMLLWLHKRHWRRPAECGMLVNGHRCTREWWHDGEHRAE